MELEYIPFGEGWKKEVSKMSKPFIIQMFKEVCMDRNELIDALRKMTLSMKAHPDCQPDSEFMDYVEAAEELLKDF